MHSPVCWLTSTSLTWPSDDDVTLEPGAAHATDDLERQSAWIDDVIRRAVARGLQGAKPLTTERVELTAPIVGRAGNHSVQGLLWSAYLDGVLDADDDTVDRLVESVIAGLRLALAAEAAAVDAVEVLNRSGVPSRVLKGVAIAQLDVDDPSDRLARDADVLVPRGDAARAIEALEASGYERVVPPVRRWWERRFAKAVPMRSPIGPELDLHFGLCDGFFGELIDHNRLFVRDGDKFELADSNLFALDLEGRFLHACVHSVLGARASWRGHRDVAMLGLTPALDWERVVGEARQAGYDSVIASAVRAAWTELGLDPVEPLATWASAHRPDERQRRAIEGYTSAEGWWAEGRTTLWALSPLDRVRFVAGLVAPSQANRRSRHRSLGAQMRQVAANVGDLLPRRAP